MRQMTFEQVNRDHFFHTPVQTRDNDLVDLELGLVELDRRQIAEQIQALRDKADEVDEIREERNRVQVDLEREEDYTEDLQRDLNTAKDQLEEAVGLLVLLRDNPLLEGREVADTIAKFLDKLEEDS